MKEKIKPYLPFIADALLIAALTGIFYFVCYIIPSEGQSSNIVIGNSETAKLDKQTVTSETASASENTYSSENIAITIDEKKTDSAVYYVADIRVSDISCIQSVFAGDTYGRGFTERLEDMDEGAVLAFNGDFYGDSDSGTVIRNGILYRSERTDSDICVLYSSGEMKTYSADEFDSEQAIENGAYQAWTFGPALLDENSKAMTSFNTTKRISSANPRTAIGYYEPGHYCVIMVDGRQENSDGMTLAELAGIFEELGCKTAYNLDGGKSSIMTFNGNVVNSPVDGGRKISDCIVIKEVD